jgi:Ni/Co efflux regulator RcnB
MKSKRIVGMLTIAAMSFGSLSAFAQGHDENRDHDRGDQRYERGATGNRGHDEDRRDEARYGHDRRDEGRNGHDRRDEARYEHERRDHDVYYYGARGPEWHRGGRVPSQYRDRQYVVDNWHEHHLSPPPRGYHWVQVGNDYVLAAVATGIIAQLIINSSY